MVFGFNKSTVVSLLSTKGVPYEIILPRTKLNHPIGYAFAFARGGSTLLHSLLSDYCSKVSWPCISINDQAFQQGIATREISVDANPLLNKGYLYLGFRHFPTNGFFIPENTAVIHLIRDPRDMLVSLYFSVKYSHELKNEKLKSLNRHAHELNIDSFVLQKADVYLKIYEQYAENLNIKKIAIYRYEDVIFDKLDWLKSMIGHLGLPYEEGAAFEISKKHDIIPSIEDEKSHIRSVRPGNFRSKLQEQTIVKLNDVYFNILRKYGYSFV